MKTAYKDDFVLNMITEMQVVQMVPENLKMKKPCSLATLIGETIS